MLPVQRGLHLPTVGVVRGAGRDDDLPRTDPITAVGDDRTHLVARDRRIEAARMLARWCVASVVEQKGEVRIFVCKIERLLEGGIKFAVKPAWGCKREQSRKHTTHPCQKKNTRDDNSAEVQMWSG